MRNERGFLPFATNLFDRCFISVVLFVAIELFWMRFIESYAPLWVGVIVSALLAQWIIRRG